MSFGNRHSSFSLLPSVGIHAVVVVSIFVLEWLRFSPFNAQNAEIILYESAVRVDVVELPKYTLKEMEVSRIVPDKIETKEEHKAEEEDKNNSQIEYQKEEEQKKHNLSKLLQGFSQKEIKKQDKKEKKVEGPDLNQLILAGNQLSKGSRLTGDAIVKERSSLQMYGDVLVEKIRPFWQLPQELKKRRYSCYVQVMISEAGHLINVKIHQTSGHDDYDTWVINSIKRAAPFPAPPKDVADDVRRGQLALAFPL